ncbi:uncharacterized protein PHALS_14741 [Plasmopara halstedii]|uniref:Uncharacterized protein n=1 Tax=Plasmopara halstedii TaxID=4781 RepID=A0A0P1AS08_PLAHL|nr:uncharacterized protein PHALS_14741 [Plasmopara halstedii]CEG43690.1 hypothetical protein PHALS_14741 [Plasmopara halstedii]|eukprot:XP_024580059.1 hypothetical protein PHALS_14741 [Plasmopara halstedii]
MTSKEIWKQLSIKSMVFCQYEGVSKINDHFAMCECLREEFSFQPAKKIGKSSKVAMSGVARLQRLS